MSGSRESLPGGGGQGAVMRRGVKKEVNHLQLNSKPSQRQASSQMAEMRHRCAVGSAKRGSEIQVFKRQGEFVHSLLKQREVLKVLE